MSKWKNYNKNYKNIHNSNCKIAIVRVIFLQILIFFIHNKNADIKAIHRLILVIHK